MQMQRRVFGTKLWHNEWVRQPAGRVGGSSLVRVIFYVAQAIQPGVRADDPDVGSQVKVMDSGVKFKIFFCFNTLV